MNLPRWFAQIGADLRKKLRNSTSCCRARIEALTLYKPSSTNKELAIYATKRISLRMNRTIKARKKNAN